MSLLLHIQCKSILYDRNREQHACLADIRNIYAIKSYTVLTNNYVMLSFVVSLALLSKDCLIREAHLISIQKHD